MNVRNSHRGVWMLPGHGPQGETYLFVLDSKNRHVVAPITVPKGMDAETIGRDLWRVLDSSEPRHALITGVAPKFRGVRRANRARLGLVSGL